MNRRLLFVCFSQDLIPRHEAMIISLLSTNWDVTVLTWSRGVESQRSLAGVRYLKIDLSAPVSSLRLLFSLPKYFSMLERLLEKEPSFDVCILNHMMLLPIARKVSANRVVYDISEYLNYDLSDYFGVFKGLVRPLIERFERYYIKRVDGVTFVGSFNGWLNSYTSIAKNSIEINNFPDLKRMPDYDLCGILKKKYKNKRVIVYVGGLSIDRGLSDLIAAVKPVLKVEPSAHFILMGRFRSDTPLLMQQIDDQGISGSIDVISHMSFEKMLSYLSIAELGVALYQVSSSRRSASSQFGKFNSRKILTYMQMGVPILVSAGNPFSDFVLETGSGDTVNEMDRNAISSKILSMIDSKIAFGEQGIAAINKYNWQKEEGRFLQFIDKVHND